MEKIKPGIYRHYKGKEYRVLFVATDSEDLSEKVVYKALYGEGKIWVRPLSMWNDTVYDENANAVNRFELVSE